MDSVRKSTEHSEVTSVSMAYRTEIFRFRACHGKFIFNENSTNLATLIDSNLVFLHFCFESMSRKFECQATDWFL